MAKRKRESHVLPKVKSKESEGTPTPTITTPTAPLPPPKEQKQHHPTPKPIPGTGSPADGPQLPTIHHLDADAASSTTTIQIVTGSYERVLHGFTATVPGSLVAQPADSSPTDPPHQQHEQSHIAFSDTFLFNAHASSIRCLALSPYIDSPDGNGKVLLATGSTDERINLYQISTRPPAPSSLRDKPSLPSLHGTSITENRRNKELGSLLHHDSSVTCLFFPSRGKLMSASEDSQIAITRTRDWVPLSTIKAPIPVPQGRPSGDTAAPGEVPSGINHFSVHPSMKLMVSVSKGEKCMRLWNLLTGKKAGVLTFSREMLSAVGEGRFGTGEGRKVEWSADGEQFAVSFERGAVVFGIDCIPTATIVPSPRTKICQMRYLPGSSSVLALSTEDGRIVFYDTKAAPARSANGAPEPAPLLAQLGGPVAGLTTRIKDFDIIPYSSSSSSSSSTTPKITYLLATGSSDGSVRLWTLPASDLQPAPAAAADTDPGRQKDQDQDQGFAAKEVGRLIGTYASGTRITCLRAFVMRGKPLGDGDGDDEGRNGKAGEDEEDSSSSSGGEESE